MDIKKNPYSFTKKIINDDNNNNNMFLSAK